MDYNKEKFNSNDAKKGFLNPIENKEWNELLCCSNNFNSSENEQLSDEEVAILWLRINQNL